MATKKIDTKSEYDKLSAYLAGNQDKMNTHEKDFIKGFMIEYENKIKKETEAAENTGGTSSAQQIAEEDGEAYTLGYDVAKDLIGYTNDEELKNVENNLKAINEDNVIEFLEGYYSNDGSGNGLFLQLGFESTKLKNKVVTPVIRAFINAVPDEFRDNDSFKTARRICQRCERRGAEDDFKNFSWVGAGIE